MIKLCTRSQQFDEYSHSDCRPTSSIIKLPWRTTTHTYIRLGQGGHTHSGGTENRRALATALAITAAYTVAEVIGGLITGSLALLADAGHMLSDNFSLGLALFAFWLSAKPPTPERSWLQAG